VVFSDGLTHRCLRKRTPVAALIAGHRWRNQQQSARRPGSTLLLLTNLVTDHVEVVFSEPARFYRLLRKIRAITHYWSCWGIPGQKNGPLKSGLNPRTAILSRIFKSVVRLYLNRTCSSAHKIQAPLDREMLYGSRTDFTRSFVK
jgi:hypothetical protein